jgi:hypothetical protein
MNLRLIPLGNFSGSSSIRFCSVECLLEVLVLAILCAFTVKSYLETFWINTETGENCLLKFSRHDPLRRVTHPFYRMKEQKKLIEAKLALDADLNRSFGVKQSIRGFIKIFKFWKNILSKEKKRMFSCFRVFNTMLVDILMKN